MQNINNKNSEEYMADEKVKSVKTFNMKKAVDKGSKWIFLLSALIAVFSLLLIMGFVFYKGLRPFFAEGYSFVDFIIHYQERKVNKYNVKRMLNKMNVHLTAQ